MIQTTFISDNGIYGKSEHQAHMTHEGSAFAIYKGHKLWTLGHPKSGLSLDSLIQPTFKRTRKSLTDLVKRLEAAHPEACAIMAGVGKADYTISEKRAMQTVITASREIFD